MTLATEVKKLTESKPFYAAAGVGDYAIEKLRELPVQLEKLQARRGELRLSAKDLPVMARDYASKAEVYAKDLPERAKGYAGVVGSRATEIYEEFASRGRQAVSRVSGEAALELEELSESAEPAVAEPVVKPAAKPAAKKTANRTPKAGG
ncbi:hypothetical protein [Streptosporangium sp. KLBMP 9127]|nr:hypothetical protein [Streptosporangium sp. KLBMP 9127]